MEIDRETFLHRLDAALGRIGLSFVRNPYLASEQKQADYLLFRDRRGVKPALAVRISLERDDADLLHGYTQAPAMPTRGGPAQRLFLQGAVRAGEDRTAKIIQTAFSIENLKGGSAGAEWIGEWLTFDPRKRLGELRPYAPPVSLPEHEIEPVRAPAPAPTSWERPLRQDDPRRRPDIAKDASLKCGFVFEERLAAAMAEKGLCFTANDDLDLRKKTDFLIVHRDGAIPFRPVALQVTLRWNDYLKMRAFRDDRRIIRAGKASARKLYLQIQKGVVPETVADALIAFLTSRRNAWTSLRKIFVEIDSTGWWEIDATERIKELGRRADPERTKLERYRGTVSAVKENGVHVVTSGARPTLFWAFLSEIADVRLLRRIQAHLRSEGNAVGEMVSFIPAWIRGGRGDPKATSVLCDQQE